MRKFLLLNVISMLFSAPAILAASGPHAISFGKAVTVKLFLGSGEDKPVDLKIRPLYVDGKIKEFTTGPAHEITDQQFTVQRVYRVNDSLPQDERTLPKWRWQRGDWLLINRTTGHIAPLRLPGYDGFYSHVAWYRDYAAYCGLSDTGEKLYVIVAQLGIRKPIVRKLLRSTSPADNGSECETPAWQRQPARVTFDVKPGQKLTFAIRGRAADVASDQEPQTGADESK